MRIKKIRLKNGYKRFRDLTIDLGDDPARIIALVGPNGCGKSSVLDGLLHLQKAYAQIGSTGSRTASYYSMDGSPSFDWQNVEITFTDGSFKDVKQSRQSSGNPNTMFSFRSPYRYNSEVKVSQITATSDIRDNKVGASDASSLDAKMEDNYRRLQAKLNDYMQSKDVRPSEARAKVIGDLNVSIKQCLDLEVFSLGNVEAGKGTLYFKKNDQSKEFEFNVLSSGEKEVIDILLDLYLKKEEFSETIFLIDEPELHINTSIQAKLLNEIDRLVGDNCQIWLTTHSIGFLRALQTTMKSKRQIIEFDPNLGLAIKPCVMHPIKATALDWRRLFAVALDDLATLVCPKIIVYCEGRDSLGQGGKERGLDAHVFNLVFAESHPDVLFISSGGNTELDQRSSIAIAILSKVFPSVEILVFKDRDVVSGRVADENDRQIYLKTNPSNHRIMRRFELENYLFDKDVLRGYCSSMGLSFDEAAYDAFVLDIVNQNLKDDVGRIKNICGIAGSINGETFKVALAEFLGTGLVAFSELRACIFDRA